MILPLRTPDDADRAAEPVRAHLERAGLLGYPTETVYGLGSATDGRSVERLARRWGQGWSRPGGS